VMIMLFLPILSCLFIKRHILSRLPEKLHLTFITVLFLLVFIEYGQKSYPVEAMQEVPKVYHELALKKDGVLLEIPLGFRDGFGKVGLENTTQMFYQTIHHKKILSGMVSRFKREKFDFFLSNQVVLELIMLELSRKTDLQLSDKDILVFLKTFDVKYILIYPEYRNSVIEGFIVKNFSRYIADSEDIDRYLLITF